MRRISLILFGVLIWCIPAHATWQTPTQIVFNNSCAASTSCSVTVSAIGAGHLLVVISHEGNTVSLSSVTAAGETFTVIPAGGGNGTNCPFNGGGNSTQFGCAYVLKSAGGATAVTCNWSGTSTASNTSCGLYEVPYTAQSIFLENNSINASHASASTFAGANFGNNFLTFLNGSNDIIFQFTNVSTGTISSIDSSFVLDNHTGQVADAHILNSFSNTPPNWTNSGAATSLVAALSFGENFTVTSVAFPESPALQAAYDNNGVGGTQELVVTSAGLFKLVFEQADAWGISQWYDLVNDPNSTTNLLLAYQSGGCTQADQENGLFQRTYHDGSPSDTKQFGYPSHFNFPLEPRSLNILEYSPSRIVIETKSLPTVLASGLLNDLLGTVDYYIYPNGKIYVHFISSTVGGFTFSNSIFSHMGLQDPTQTGTNPPDSQGWIRASTTQNPYTNAGLESYVFAYWSPNTPAPNTNYTKASILMVRNPNNLHDSAEVIHSWQSCAGFGFVRWGFQSSGTITLPAGGTEVEDVMIQLGTQNSTVLPNINSSTIAGPIATAYINNPTPPLVTSISTAVNQGAQVQFTSNLGTGTWALSGTDGSGNPNSGAGTMTSGGSYTAPSSVTAQQTIGGFQLLPNNHIFNTRIDSLPVNANNSTWLNVVNVGTGQPNNDSIGFPINYVTPSTSSVQNMKFFYTSANNGGFPLPSFPNISVQGGYYDGLENGNRDHHQFAFDTTTGQALEMYQFYAECDTTAAAVSGNVATLTCATNPITSGFFVGATVCIGSFSGSDTYFNSQSACPGGAYALTAITSTSISYALTHVNASATTSGSATLNTQGSSCSTTGNCRSQSGLRYNYSDYVLPPVSTNAAGTAQLPIQLRLQEMEQAVTSGGTINHVLGMTFGAGFLASSNIWPATQFANDANTVPFGARFRLKSSFNISGYSAIAQVLLKQMQQYGWMVTDGGNNWSSESETNVWPASYVQAMTDVSNAGISCTITNTQVVSGVATVTCPNNFAANYRVFISGTTNDGGILNNAWYVLTGANSTTFQFSFGTNFASAADTGTARSGLANYVEFVDESGLMVSATSGVTTHNREIATFTPTTGSPISTDIALQGVAINFPQDYLYIMAGSSTYQIPVLVNIGSVTWSMSPSIGSLSSNGAYTPPAALASATTSTFTATSTVNGAVSATLLVTVFPNAAIRILPSQSSNYTDSFGNVWWANTGTSLPIPSPAYCCGCPSIPAVTDHKLWDCEVGYGSAFPIDFKSNFIVPNGSYQITYRYGTRDNAGTLTNTLSANGNVFFTGDMGGIAGGANKLFSQVTQNVVVTNNQLSIGVWSGGPQAPTTNVGAPVSSISIIPGGVAPAVGHLP